MFERKKQVDLPGKEKLAETVAAMKQEVSRPFLLAIRNDRIAKQEQMWALEREINRLWELERFAESHESVDALIRYFVDQTP